MFCFFAVGITAAQDMGIDWTTDMTYNVPDNKFKNIISTLSSLNSSSSVWSLIQAFNINFIKNKSVMISPSHLYCVGNKNES